MPKLARQRHRHLEAKRRESEQQNVDSTAEEIERGNTAGNVGASGAARKNASPSSFATSPANNNSSSSDPLSRGQRKRFLKRQQYMQKEQFAREHEHTEAQKKRIDGLDAIKQELLATVNNRATAPAPATRKHIPTFRTNKSRRQLVGKEVSHLNMVLDHPRFQANPFDTIREHLENTIVVTKMKEEATVAKDNDKKQKQLADQRTSESKKTRVRKKRKRFKATRSKTR